MKSQGTRNIFTYGSLMFPEVWQRVVSRRYKNCDAHTVGLIRKKIRHSTYPVAIESTREDLLHGRLYRNVTPVDLEKLDRFEGRYYERKPVPVIVGEESAPLHADVYLLKPKYHLLAGPQDWSPRHFQKHELQRFIHSVYARKFS